MLDKSLSEELLGIILSGGADFAELFFETTRNGSIIYLDGRIDKITDNTITGVGMRAFVGTRTVFASTSDITRNV
jgi:TldD protein